jgi:hypothetical protein
MTECDRNVSGVSIAENRCNPDIWSRQQDSEGSPSLSFSADERSLTISLCRLRTVPKVVGRSAVETYSAARCSTTGAFRSRSDLRLSTCLSLPNVTLRVGAFYVEPTDSPCPHRNRSDSHDHSASGRPDSDAGGQHTVVHLRNRAGRPALRSRFVRSLPIKPATLILPPTPLPAACLSRWVTTNSASMSTTRLRNRHSQDPPRRTTAPGCGVQSLQREAGAS